VKHFELGLRDSVLRGGFFECLTMLGIAKEVAEAPLICLRSNLTIEL
jgi:hypothetical protein